MGQYKSYQELSLERQVSDLEKEVIALKTSQRYQFSQVAYHVANTEYMATRTLSQMGWYYPAVNQYTVAGKLVFYGANKNNVARGRLYYSTKDNVSVGDYAWFFPEALASGDAPSVHRWLVYIGAESSVDVRFLAYMNMPGVLQFTWGI